jgi:hypothetical protein
MKSLKLMMYYKPLRQYGSNDNEEHWDVKDDYVKLITIVSTSYNSLFMAI